MTREQMRDMLRRRLNEDVADQWGDDTLNLYLNEALQFVQQQVLAIRPDAFTRIDDTDVVDASSDYILALIAKPVGFHHEVRLLRRPSSTSQEWTPLVMVAYRDAVSRTTGELQYAHHGRFFFLSPAPSVSVVRGLRLEWVPTLAMANDSDVPDLHIGLHKAVVYHGEILALGEDKDTDAIKAAKAERDEVLSQIGSYYQLGGSQPAYVTVRGVRAS